MGRDGSTGLGGTMGPQWYRPCNRSDFRGSSLLPTMFLVLFSQSGSAGEQETQAPKPEVSPSVSVAASTEQQEVSSVALLFPCEPLGPLPTHALDGQRLRSCQGGPLSVLPHTL